MQAVMHVQDLCYVAWAEPTCTCFCSLGAPLTKVLSLQHVPGCSVNSRAQQAVYSALHTDGASLSLTGIEAEADSLYK